MEFDLQKIVSQYVETGSIDEESCFQENDLEAQIACKNLKLQGKEVNLENIKDSSGLSDESMMRLAYKMGIIQTVVCYSGVARKIYRLYNTPDLSVEKRDLKIERVLKSSNVHKIVQGNCKARRLDREKISISSSLENVPTECYVAMRLPCYKYVERCYPKITLKELFMTVKFTDRLFRSNNSDIAVEYMSKDLEYWLLYFMKDNTKEVSFVTRKFMGESFVDIANDYGSTRSYTHQVYYEFTKRAFPLCKAYMSSKSDNGVLKLEDANKKLDNTILQFCNAVLFDKYYVEEFEAYFLDDAKLYKALNIREYIKNKSKSKLITNEDIDELNKMAAGMELGIKVNRDIIFKEYNKNMTTCRLNADKLHGLLLEYLRDAYPCGLVTDWKALREFKEGFEKTHNCKIRRDGGYFRNLFTRYNDVVIADGNGKIYHADNIKADKDTLDRIEEFVRERANVTLTIKFVYRRFSKEFSDAYYFRAVIAKYFRDTFTVGSNTFYLLDGTTKPRTVVDVLSEISLRENREVSIEDAKLYLDPEDASYLEWKATQCMNNSLLPLIYGGNGKYVNPDIVNINEDALMKAIDTIKVDWRSQYSFNAEFLYTKCNIKDIITNFDISRGVALRDLLLYKYPDKFKRCNHRFGLSIEE